MNAKSKKLIVQALHHWRCYSIPTYLALRLFIDQIPKSGSSDFLIRYITEKIPLRKSGRYRIFSRFKERDPDGNIEYRDMYAASPSTALSEAYVLSILATIDELKANRKPYLYSYRLSSKPSSRSFQYYYSGYKERNDKVSWWLGKDTQYMVIACDIKSFYPTVDKMKAIIQLRDCVRASKVASFADLMESVSNQLIDNESPGVPIGPGLSHILANFSLESVDREMYKLLGMRYLRYVDDILLVLHKGEIESVKARLADALKKNGFELNPKKDDEISHDDWMSNVSDIDENPAGKKFNELVNTIKLLLWERPDRRDELSKFLRDKGIGFPVQRFAVDATYSGYHWYAKFYLGIKKYHQFIKEKKYATNEPLLTDISNLYGEFYKTASGIRITYDDSHPVLKKLQEQTLRYYLNRLFYLTPYSDYKRLLDIIPESIEFYEYRLVLEALISKSVNELIKVPGPTVFSFASIFKELDLGKIRADDLEFLKPDTPENLASLESIASLAAFGILDPPEDWVNQLSPEHQVYIKFCMFSPNTSRELDDYSFEDELQTLQIDSAPSLREYFLTTRFSESEQVSFDMIMLGRPSP